MIRTSWKYSERNNLLDKHACLRSWKLEIVFYSNSDRRITNFSSSSCVWNKKKKKRNSKISGYLLRSHSRVAASASTSIKPRRAPGGWQRGHSAMMWFAVCWSAMQSQAGLPDRPHLHTSSALKHPTPVHSLLSLTQACRGRSDPAQHLDGETTYSHSLLVDGCHSTDHILAIQWAFVSLGRVVFFICGKGAPRFQSRPRLPLVMVWWRRWSGSMA